MPNLTDEISLLLKLLSRSYQCHDTPAPILNETLLPQAATCPYAVAWFKRHPEYHLGYSGGMQN